MNKIIILSCWAVLSIGIHAQTVVYSEDFQNGFPVNFSFYNLDGLQPDASVSEYVTPWIIKADPENPSDSVASSTSFFNPVGQANRWMVTPPVTLGAFGNFIEWKGKAHDASFADGFKVLLSKTDNQTASFTDTVIVVSEELAEWTTHKIDLSAKGHNNETVYFAFINDSYNDFILYINDIVVTKEDPVSVEELAQLNLHVFPNPTTDWIYVNYTQKIDEIQVYDFLGSLVKTAKGKAIDISELKSGTYLLKVVAQGTSIVKKITKN